MARPAQAGTETRLCLAQNPSFQRGDKRFHADGLALGKGDAFRKAGCEAIAVKAVVLESKASALLHENLSGRGHGKFPGFHGEAYAEALEEGLLAGPNAGQQGRTILGADSFQQVFFLRSENEAGIIAFKGGPGFRVHAAGNPAEHADGNASRMGQAEVPAGVAWQARLHGVRKLESRRFGFEAFVPQEVAEEQAGGKAEPLVLGEAVGKGVSLPCGKRAGEGAIPESGMGQR